MILSAPLRIPAHIRRGIRDNARGFPARVSVHAFDVETVDGEPFTLQFAGPGPRSARVERVSRRTITARFLAYLGTHGEAHRTNLLGAHNLEHDLGVAFVDWPEIWEAATYDAVEDGVTLHLHHYSAPWHTITVHGRTWLLVDTRSWFPQSLDALGAMLHLDARKLPKPRYLGKRRPTRAEWPAFRAYALNDALATRALLLYIVNAHREFGVRLSVSAAHLASRVFRHVVMGSGVTVRRRGQATGGDAGMPNLSGRVSSATGLGAEFTVSPRSIPFPSIKGSESVLEASLLAYHGGKNGLYVKPGVYDNVREVDIISAYPAAMKALPPMTRGSWEVVDWLDADPDTAGIYRVGRGETGAVCPYGVFPIGEGTWLTGYELRAAARFDSLAVIFGDVWGFVWHPSTGARNPFAEYVDLLYDKKQRAEGPEREMYKLLLNSLYGKLIQRNGDTAGGLFNPFWAAQITGWTRARLHQMEHRYQALHSSTDAILTQAEDVETGTGLGDLEIRAAGRLTVLRNKLYILEDGDRIVKAALHGFRGTAEQLRAMIRRGHTSYRVLTMIRPRDARRVGAKPFRMMEKRFKLHLPAAAWEAARG